MKNPAGRPAIERFHLIMERLVGGQPVFVSQLAEKLEVHRKTIERDLDFMADRLQLPIERGHRGVTLLQPVKTCPICTKPISDMPVKD